MKGQTPRPFGSTAPTAAPARVHIEHMTPAVDGGRFAIKRVVGESITVEADVFAEGHDQLAGVLRWRRVGAEQWHEITLDAVGNDRWRATFTVTEMGRYEYTIAAWVDPFASWRHGFSKKVNAGQSVSSELLEGAELIRQAASRAPEAEAAWLVLQAEVVGGTSDDAVRVAAALSMPLATAVARYPDRSLATEYPHGQCVVVECERARYGSWYEMFPRSCAPEAGRHGTFADCEARLPYVREMGFDVLYLPPIHPIGVTHRKGPNNTVGAAGNDPGSPWAIGAAEGGHTAVHPALGTLEDFHRLVAAARRHGIEIALDLAFQCSPDHPWVREHPQWFRQRPDGSVQYAENPPKKYQDIYPLYFEGPDWKRLWEALREVVRFWIDHGITIFRVDNPHTKPFAFWEWLIAAIRAEHPEVIFLAEAFTRPKVMRQLAKLGFAQSYTYFTWRTTKAEITEYFTELTRAEVCEYMRGNLFVNTPDILHEYLQFGGRAAFQIRLVLAATLGASYGVYGPAFELCEARAVPGTEEYLDSEKYQIRCWNTGHPDSLREFIARVNQIRRENPALHSDRSLQFLPVDNPALIAYAKHSMDGMNVILTVVNLDPHHPQSGWLTVPLAAWGLDPRQPYQAHELLSGARYLWQGEHSYVALDPQVVPAHIIQVRRHVRTEQDFDYFM